MSSEKHRGAIILQPEEGQALNALGVTITYKTIGADTNGQWLVLVSVRKCRPTTALAILDVYGYLLTINLSIN